MNKLCVSPKVEAKDNVKGKCLIARENIRKDELIISFLKNFVKKPTKTSMQVDEDKHQESHGGVDEYLNHSCDPNGYINFENVELKALRDIKKGEEITYNYLTSDYELSEPFKCECGSTNCVGIAKGFKYLDKTTQKKLYHQLSPFLRKKMEK